MSELTPAQLVSSARIVRRFSERAIRRIKLAYKLGIRRKLPVALPGEDEEGYCCVPTKNRAEPFVIAVADSLPLGKGCAGLVWGCSNCISRNNMQAIASRNTKETLDVDFILNTRPCRIANNKLIVLPVEHTVLRKSSTGILKFIQIGIGTIISPLRTRTIPRNRPRPIRLRDLGEAPDMPPRQPAPIPERIIPDHIRQLFHRPDQPERPR